MSVEPVFLLMCFLFVLTDLQGIQRWRLHINPAVDTCLDRPLLCEIPCCCKSRDILGIICEMLMPFLLKGKKTAYMSEPVFF